MYVCVYIVKAVASVCFLVWLCVFRATSLFISQLKLSTWFILLVLSGGSPTISLAGYFSPSCELGFLQQARGANAYIPMARPFLLEIRGSGSF